MSNYNDKIWMSYVDKYKRSCKVARLNKHDGKAILCKDGFIIPYSVDNEQLLFCSDGDWGVQKVTWLIKKLPITCQVVTVGMNNISVVIPEVHFTDIVRKILGVRHC